jgi:predicted O-methyltransferase YrrM
MRHSRLLAVTLALLVAVAGQAVAQLQTDRMPDVPYVPSREPVVMKMLEMAKVTRNDVVYDLGSGDGRIVITAAKKFGARGVGVEIDPKLVREATRHAREAGVADRVKFVQGDIFEADIREATVITMYLLPDVNMRLRPKLLSDLKPGTRIVSHNYDLGDWKPEDQATLDVGSVEHFVYFWVVPQRAARQP